MNSLIKNKREGLKKAIRLGHKLGTFEKSGMYLVSRCKKCGNMLYITGKCLPRTYRKMISGDTLSKVCPGRVLTVKELVAEYETNSTQERK